MTRFISPIARTLVLCLLPWLGCAFDPSGFAPEGDGPLVPPVDDAGNPLPCAQWQFAPAHFDACLIADPEGPLTLTMDSGLMPYNYDTTTGTLTDPTGAPIPHANQIYGSPSVRLVSVDSFDLGEISRLRVTGQMPLVMAVWGDATIRGEIDASSKRTEVAVGAGANSLACNGEGLGGDGGDAAGGGGGGGGGAFNGSGGLGGQGNNDANTVGTAGLSADPPPIVRGGCPGGKGGQDTGAVDGGGQGGAGGGAIQITSLATITVYGRLHAGGQGGRAANPDIGGSDASKNSGGGGGGSGGYLGLQADTIDVQSGALLAVNGGGGGAGAKNNAGQDGDDAEAVATAAGGGTANDGGAGGAGGFLNTVVGQPGVADGEGGGGGGGSVGYILMDARVRNTHPNAVFSPNWSALPTLR